MEGYLQDEYQIMNPSQVMQNFPVKSRTSSINWNAQPCNDTSFNQMSMHFILHLLVRGITYDGTTKIRIDRNS